MWLTRPPCRHCGPKSRLPDAPKIRRNFIFPTAANCQHLQHTDFRYTTQKARRGLSQRSQSVTLDATDNTLQLGQYGLALW